MVKNQSVQPLVLLFAGQGNPVIGMGSDLWDRNAMTKRIWDCASDITGKDIRRLCQKGPMNRLIQTTVQQVAVTAINVTLYHLWAEHRDPEHISGSCGHSVGEYSALYAAGAIALEALFDMIHVRANIMHEISQRHKGAMLAVKGADYPTIQSLILSSGMAVDISCDNSQRQQVIGGTAAELSPFSHILMDSGLEVVKLAVSGAWHTRLMGEGVQRMRDALESIDISPPVHDVMMNVTGQAEYNPEQIKENLCLHLTHTVQWTRSMEALLQRSPPVVFVEMSHKAYLGQILADFDGFAPEALIHCRNSKGQ